MVIKESEKKLSRGWEYIELKIVLEEKIEQISIFNTEKVGKRNENKFYSL